MTMIEFTHDGPFAEKDEPLFPDRVRMIGLGQTGAAVCDQLVMHGRPSQDIWVFDSDQQTVESSVVPNRICSAVIWFTDLAAVAISRWLAKLSRWKKTNSHLSLTIAIS